MNQKTLRLTLAIAALCLLFEVIAAQKSIKTPLHITFYQDLPRGATLVGFGEREDWGRWTVAKEARIAFVSEFEEPHVFRMTAKAFGPNAGAAVEVYCGRKVADLTFNAEAETKEFICGQHVREISFVVPQPTSPHALGLSGDGRSLGIGLIGLEIRRL